MFNKDKNKGLSEEERLQKQQFEKIQLESMERLKRNLPQFRAEYNNLVEQYGLVHVIRYNFDPVRGMFASIEVQDCYEQVQQMKKQVEKQEGNGVASVIKD